MNNLDNVLNKFIHADVLDGLKTIPDDCISLIFTSPPYNVGILYGNRNDREPYIQYIQWLKDIMKECYRVLRTGGRLIINIDSMVNHENDNAPSKNNNTHLEYYRPVYADLINNGREIGLNFFTEICWFKHQVVGRATAWGSYMSASTPIIRRNHEYLLIWSKGDWKLEGDSEQSDMTDEEFQAWTMSFWHIQPETRAKGGHPAPFPEELARRCIKLFCYRGDIVLDPFMGSGTTAYVAKQLSRNFIGIDNDPHWVEFAQKRIEKASDIFGSEERYIPRSERIKAKKTKQNADINSERADMFG